MLHQKGPQIILASESQGRAQMLRNVGLEFSCRPSGVDERAVRRALSSEGGAPEPSDIAEVLARAKAQMVSKQQTEALVIGADQVLALGDEIFEKPKNMDQARENLWNFRGQAHHLHSAVCVAEKGEVIWSAEDRAALTMRPFTAEFLDAYLACAGELLCKSVGAYQLEGLGLHLFSEIKGDYFTILGLPLVPLLAFLRDKGILPR